LLSKIQGIKKLKRIFNKELTNLKDILSPTVTPNAIGLRRAQIPASTRDEIKRAYKLLYHSGFNTTHAISEIEKMATTPEVKYFAEFVKQSKRGICPGGSASETRMADTKAED